MRKNKGIENEKNMREKGERKKKEIMRFGKRSKKRGRKGRV